MAVWTACGRCGKKYPKGDKIAEYSHNLKCRKSVMRGGLDHPFK